MNFRFPFLFLLLFSILFASCESDIRLNDISNEISLHPNLIVPIGGASLSLGQIISNNDSLHKFQIGDDSEINYISLDSSEFKLPKIDILGNSQELKMEVYPSPFQVITLPPYTALPSLNYPTYSGSVRIGTNVTNNDDRIDSLNVKSAIISVIIDVSQDLGNFLPSDLKFTIHFPNGKIRMLDGSSSDILFSPSGFGTINSIPVSNFMMGSANDQSTIPVEIRLEARSGNLPVTLSPLSIITCRLKFTQLDYLVAYGNFKSKFNVPFPLEQSIDFTKDIPNSKILFKDPQVFISGTSNIGTYLNFKIDYIKAILSTSQSFIPVFASFNGVRSTIISFDNKSGFPGEIIGINFPTLDKDWGETNQLFENVNTDQTYPMPDKLEYNFSASVDSVKNNQSKTPSFITSDARIKINLKTIIPLNFNQGSYYQYQDSIQNAFIMLSNALNQSPYNTITSTALILNITNGLPVKTTFKFELNDSVGNVLSTTFEKNYSIQAGKVDANGLVQPGKETKQTIQITVTNDQLVILRKARKIMYTVRIEGEDINSNIHFTKLNTFDLKVGLFVKGDVNTNIGTKTQN